jgi:uncharacterized membrane protein HdeD (DUF308 family)
MSGTHAERSPHGLGYTRITAKWGWFVALGVGLVVVGILALGDVMAFAVISVIFIGAMLVVGGIFQIVHAFMTRDWRAFALNLFMGVLYVVAGLLVMREPVQTSVILTLFVIAALLVGGITRVIVALQHRHLVRWWLLLVGGVISIILAIILAIMLYGMLPWSGLWILGTLIAVELLVQGLGWITFGFSLRALGRSAG